MNFSRGTLTIAALAGAASLALAPTATAATTYQITVIPPIGTVRANNLVTLGALVTPTPTGTDGSTPVELELTDPSGDVTARSIPLTLGAGTAAIRTHEAGRYTAVFTFAPPNGEPTDTTAQFDVVASSGLGS
ncbi:hypothetical protein CJ179_42995 [Rhodococcus sp. ACS1]|uniref:hypothetical protein n=1 Tax=Rhodococcus TaxID=1827 RepID=UPI000BB101F4|nr:MULTISPECIES: hypothetical protein [Rhodococcus]PBC36742.1 hypothetical protein CJ179_42995 [Rhodococcus sp. ACS1]QSE81289.1 hypothetical protein JWS14_20140 [Rhodococcus koreensis]